MAVLDPTGGMGRDTLLQSLAKLRQQYAGADKTPGKPQERGVDTQVLSDDYLRNWLAANPGQAPSQAPGSVMGAGPAFAGVAMPGRPGDTVVGDYPGLNPNYGGIAPDGYGSQGWGAGGINLYNPNLARGDAPQPGPGWTMDNYGTPFWRHDYIAGPGGKPIIKGSDGYSGDYPLMTAEELAKWGIQ